MMDTVVVYYMFHPPFAVIKL